MKANLVWFLILAVPVFQLNAQSIQFSIPQKIGQYNHFNIIGACSEGVLVHQFGKSGHVIELYNSKMVLTWRKPIPVPERNFDVIDLDEFNDTLRLIYSQLVNDKQYLKYQLFNNNLTGLLTKPAILDSFTGNFTESNSIDVSYHLRRKFALIYYEINDFEKNRNIPYIILDSKGGALDRKTAHVNDAFTSPSLSDAYVFENGGQISACFIYGDYESKNPKNDYPFPKYGVTFVGSQTTNYVMEEKGNLLSSGDCKWDYQNNKLVICGLYATSTGNSANGMFYAAVNIEKGVISQKFTPFSHQTDLQINGDANHKKTPEVVNYKVRGIVLRNDGGCLLQCEQIYQTTETFRNTSLNFSVTSPTTLNFYHYDDILTASFGADGEVLWTKVLHKKQESEGDGGYYLSYAGALGEKNISILYNDGTYSSATLTGYILAPDGSIERHELFNNERKLVMMIPQFGKQVSYNELVVPSIRKNMLEFIKFTL